MMLSGKFESIVDQESEVSWYENLRRFNDASIYQTWAYGAERWGERQLSHLVVRRDKRVVGAAQVRIVRLPVLGSGLAYVRWGPMTRSDSDERIEINIGSVTEALVEEYVRKRGLVLRIIPPCYRGETSAEEILRQWEAAGFVRKSDVAPYRTLRLDLSPELHLLRKGLKQKWRNMLNGAERNGLDVVEGDSDGHYHEFSSIYDEMLARKQFETLVSVEEMGRVHKRLPPDLKMRVFVARKDGAALNAVVVAVAGDTGIYLLGATNDAGTKLKGSYLLHWRAIEWLKSRGVRWYDLGGINPDGNPGVYRFKCGFSGEEAVQPGCYEYSQVGLSRLAVRIGERCGPLLKRGRIKV